MRSFSWSACHRLKERTGREAETRRAWSEMGGVRRHALPTPFRISSSFTSTTTPSFLLRRPGARRPDLALRSAAEPISTSVPSRGIPGRALAGGPPIRPKIPRSVDAPMDLQPAMGTAEDPPAEQQREEGSGLGASRTRDLYHPAWYFSLRRNSPTQPRRSPLRGGSRPAASSLLAHFGFDGTRDGDGLRRLPIVGRGGGLQAHVHPHRRSPGARRGRRLSIHPQGDEPAARLPGDGRRPHPRPLPLNKPKEPVGALLDADLADGNLVPLSGLGETRSLPVRREGSRLLHVPHGRRARGPP